jgi:hypothetical protein
MGDFPGNGYLAQAADQNGNIKVIRHDGLLVRIGAAIFPPLQCLRQLAFVSIGRCLMSSSG